MVKEKYARNRGVQLLESILEKIGPIFTIDEVRSIAVDHGMNSQDLRSTLYSLVRSGWISRLKRGTYMLTSSLFPDELHPFALANALVNPMAISHWSALGFHGLTTQIPPMVQAITPRKVVTPEMRSGRANRPRGRAVWKVLDVEVEFIYIEKKRFFGLQQEWVDRWHRILITDRERTFLDMVARSDLFGGIEFALSTFEESGGEFDPEKLAGYALRYEMGSVIKRLGWVLESCGVESGVLKPLREYKVQNYYLLDPGRPRKGSSDKGWNIIRNI